MAIIKRSLFIICVIALINCGVAFSQESGEQYTLARCYELALKQSETIAIDVEHFNVAQAHFIQALGTILPHVSFSYTDIRQDPSASNSAYPRSSFESSFTFKQTLFTGFKEFIAMSGSKLEESQRLKEKARAEQLLLVDVADAFYLLMEQKEDLNILEIVRQALKNRIRELRQREKLGRSMKSEVVNAEAQMYSVEAEMYSVKAQEKVAQDLLEFLTGKPIPAIQDTMRNPVSVEEEAHYTAKVKQRPDVIAADYAWGVAKKIAGIAKSGLVPSVSVTGDYYPSGNIRPKDSEWDAMLQVGVPIFEGTETYGAIKEANANARAAGLLLRQTERSAVQDIRDSCANLSYAISKRDKQRKAFASARMNYKLQNKDYKYSLVSNLDVLQAIQTAQNSARIYAQTVYEAKRYYWELLAATGDATKEKLNESF
ncbi:MAG: TolC family protein [Candidatus Omnitrophica bacterium]|nr:TolC family protein [Candidatus Omnitrophota bacterium]